MLYIAQLYIHAVDSKSERKRQRAHDSEQKRLCSRDTTITVATSTRAGRKNKKFTGTAILLSLRS